MSLRYVLIISKCLSELNIRNLNLLTGLNNRFIKLIELEKKSKDKDRKSDDYIDCNSIAQILTNFVKLEYVDYESFKAFEDLFFEKCKANPNTIQKETIFSIFYAHCSFYKTLYLSYKKNAKDNKPDDNRQFKNKKGSTDIDKKNEAKNHKFYKALM